MFCSKIESKRAHIWSVCDLWESYCDSHILRMIDHGLSTSDQDPMLMFYLFMIHQRAKMIIGHDPEQANTICRSQKVELEWQNILLIIALHCAK